MVFELKSLKMEMLLSRKPFSVLISQDAKAKRDRCVAAFKEMALQGDDDSIHSLARIYTVFPLDCLPLMPQIRHPHL